MKTRLALVACLGPADGPWIRSRGNEKGVRVQGLADGERIISRLVLADGSTTVAELGRNDTWPLPDNWTKIMFEKQCKDDCGVGHTQVELLVA
jgi:hypothetical protein